LKRKKGFTLTELLATVAVMVIVLTIAVPLYNTVRENTLNSSYSNLVAYIESKAQNYANDTGAVLTNVDTLIKEGYLQADDDKSNIYDPRTNEVLNCYMIMIVKKDGELIDLEIQERDYDVEDHVNYIEFAEALYEIHKQKINVYVYCVPSVKIHIQLYDIKSEADFKIRIAQYRDNSIKNRIKSKIRG